jgi:hypothetical protein
LRAQGLNPLFLICTLIFSKKCCSGFWGLGSFGWFDAHHASDAGAVCMHQFTTLADLTQVYQLCAKFVE